VKRFVLATLFVVAAFAVGGTPTVHRSPRPRPIADAEPQVWPAPDTAFDTLSIPRCFFIKDTATGATSTAGI